ncbi:MAG: MBL fold metallo-hydrolase [Planctomycetia bacterium]|nr:MBL fold metallo-hydrolase [Planctomycetia bacterium]
MSISFQVLGSPGNDNALLVRIDNGQGVETLLFDCGEGCLAELSFAEILAIDHLFFSHLHMDHVAGFDAFFRATFNRTNRPNRIWGPPETGRILQHRFQGVLWNLHEEMSGTWHITDIHADRLQTVRLELSEAFAVLHNEGARPHARTAYEGAGFTIEALTMDHRTPTLAYLVREKPRRNVDVSRLSALGLRGGPWLKQLKDSAPDQTTVVIDGATHAIDDLQRALVVETPGDSIAYLTDFLLDDVAMERLCSAFAGCGVIVCEGQYRHADLELARKNFHMTTQLSATLAQRLRARELVLFHLSDRYDEQGWLEMLREAQAIFPNANYPPHWKLSGEG